MLYMNKETKAYGLSFADAVRQTPALSVPPGTVEFGAYVGYARAERPEYEQVTQALREIAPTDGVQRWEVVELAAHVISANQARELAALINLNNTAYTAAIDLLTVGYPPHEKATWERQRAEALAWDKDATAPTPWIDIAAAARGIDRIDYLGRTLPKAILYEFASAHFTGLRQGYEDAIKAGATVTDFTYTLPVAA